MQRPLRSSLCNFLYLNQNTFSLHRFPFGRVTLKKKNATLIFSGKLCVPGSTSLCCVPPGQKTFQNYKQATLLLLELGVFVGAAVFAYEQFFLNRKHFLRLGRTCPSRYEQRQRWHFQVQAAGIDEKERRKKKKPQRIINVFVF